MRFDGSTPTASASASRGRSRSGNRSGRLTRPLPDRLNGRRSKSYSVRSHAKRGSFLQEARLVHGRSGARLDGSRPGESRTYSEEKIPQPEKIAHKNLDPRTIKAPRPAAPARAFFPRGNPAPGPVLACLDSLQEFIGKIRARLERFRIPAACAGSEIKFPGLCEIDRADFHGWNTLDRSDFILDDLRHIPLAFLSCLLKSRLAGDGLVVILDPFLEKNLHPLGRLGL